MFCTLYGVWGDDFVRKIFKFSFYFISFNFLDLLNNLPPPLSRKGGGFFSRYNRGGGRLLIRSICLCCLCYY